MVVISLVNELSNIAINGKTIEYKGIARGQNIDVGSNPSFTFAADGYNISAIPSGPQIYTVPLGCVPSTDPTNVCSYTSDSIASVWTFQAPLYHNAVIAGYLIGSITSQGTYQLYCGLCGIQATVSVPPNVVVTTWYNNVQQKTATSFIPVTNIGVATVEYRAAYNASTTSGASNLKGVFDTEQYKTLFDRYYKNTGDDRANIGHMYYSLDIISTKVFLKVKYFMENTTMNVAISLDDRESGLGFDFEAFYYPPFILNSKGAIGFYSAANTTKDALSTAPLIPQVPFTIQNGSYYVAARGAGKWLGTVSSTSASVFAFLPCPTGTFMQLVLIDHTKASGWQVVGMDSSNSLTSESSTLDTSCSSNGTQWGVYQVWYNNAYQWNVAIACKKGGKTYIMTNNSTNAALPTFAMAPLPTQDPGIIGFLANGVASSAYMMKMNVVENATAVTGMYRTYCFSGTPVMGSTTAGQVLCSSDDFQADSLYQAAQQQFITNVCSGEYETGCRSVAGNTPEMCTGWITDAYYESCSYACSSKQAPNLIAYCDNAKRGYCASSDKRANSGDCACLNRNTSSFKVVNRGNLSYKGYVENLNQTYGLTGNTDLKPECWWDACNTGAGGGISLSAVSSCPTNVNSCINSIKGLVVGAKSQVRVDLVNDCSIPSDSKNKYKTPCSSLAGMLSSMSVKTGPGYELASDFDPTEFRKFDWVTLGVLAFILFILILISIFYTAKKVINSGAFSKDTKS